MAKTGRPTSLTPEVADRIVQAVRAGSYVSHAAEYAGVHRDTVYGWLERGRREHARIAKDPKGRPDADEAAFAEFSDRVMRAEAEALIEAVAAWKTASRSDWRAAKEWLARRHNEEWGDKARLEHSGPDGQPISLAGLERLMGVDDDDD